MAVVVSDTSPLRALDHLGHLDWLEELFEQVYLPPAVAHELREPPAAFRPLDVNRYAFLHVLGPKDSARVTELLSVLDAGEAEAIALAEQLSATVILIDELTGREVARRLGFSVQGSLGMLIEAKQRGWCSTSSPCRTVYGKNFGSLCRQHYARPFFGERVNCPSLERRAFREIASWNSVR